MGCTRGFSQLKGCLGTLGYLAPEAEQRIGMPEMGMSQSTPKMYFKSRPAKKGLLSPAGILISGIPESYEAPELWGPQGHVLFRLVEKRALPELRNLCFLTEFLILDMGKSSSWGVLVVYLLLQSTGRSIFPTAFSWPWGKRHVFRPGGEQRCLGTGAAVSRGRFSLVDWATGCPGAHMYQCLRLRFCAQRSLELVFLCPTAFACRLVRYQLLVLKGQYRGEPVYGRSLSNPKPVF